MVYLLSHSCRVDGQYLNYDNNPLRTTDFTGLCAEMAKLQAPSKKIGKHSSVSDDSEHLIPVITNSPHAVATALSLSYSEK